MVRLDPQTTQAAGFVQDLQGNPALIMLFAIAMVAVAAIAAFGCAKGAKKKPREKISAKSVQYYGGQGYTAAPTYSAPSAGKSANTGSSDLETGLAVSAMAAMMTSSAAAGCGGGGGGCDGGGGGCGGGGCGGGGCGGGGCGGGGCGGGGCGGC